MRLCLFLLFLFPACDDGESQTEGSAAPQLDLSSPLLDAAGDSEAQELVVLDSGLEDLLQDQTPLEPDQVFLDMAADSLDQISLDAAPPLFPWRCSEGINFLYAPGGEEPGAFPDDYYTSADPESLTGLRVDLSEELAPWAHRMPGQLDSLFTEMNRLDGFGTNAGIFLPFDGALLNFEGMAEQIKLLELQDNGVKELPYEVQLFEEDHVLELLPIYPLKPKTRHGVLVMSDLPSADGRCFRPGPALAGLLSRGAGEPRLQAMAPRYAELLEKSGISVESLAAALVFTTQSVTESSEAVAADIQSRDYEWSEGLHCFEDRGFQRCDGHFTAFDYRVGGDIVEGSSPDSQYDLWASIWFERSNEPQPVVLVGHGINDSREFGGYVKQLAELPGMAAVATDAVMHGEHPAGAAENNINLLMEFFEVAIADQRIDALKLRDNFRQSTFDKLQLIRLLQQNPDLNGDGRDELDMERLTYFGASLGGIMGSEMLALNDSFGCAYLGMPGGRLSEFVRSLPEEFEPLLDLLLGRSSPLLRERLFSAVQTLIERGDPSNFGKVSSAPDRHGPR